jgi:hypothetical protein
VFDVEAHAVARAAAAAAAATAAAVSAAAAASTNVPWAAGGGVGGAGAHNGSRRRAFSDMTSRSLHESGGAPKKARIGRPPKVPQSAYWCVCGGDFDSLWEKNVHMQHCLRFEDARAQDRIIDKLALGKLTCVCGMPFTT